VATGGGWRPSWASTVRQLVGRPKAWAMRLRASLESQDGCSVALGIPK
jgi:hypothetical protein